MGYEPLGKLQKKIQVIVNAILILLAIIFVIIKRK